MTAITWKISNLVDLDIKIKKSMIRWILCTDQRPT